MKLILESILFLIIMNMIGTLDTRLRTESTENKDLKLQVAAYETINQQAAALAKAQANQMIALR